MTDENRAKVVFAAAYEFQKSGRFGKAIASYKDAVSINPKLAAAHNNLGNCLRSIGQFEPALKCFEQALILEPNRQSTILNQSLAYLSLNLYQEAWPGYQARLFSIEYRKELLTSGKPEWKGQPLGKGARLFIYSNQGIGDELQALRFIPIIAQQVEHIIWEVHESIYEFVKDMPMVVDVVMRSQTANDLPAFDYQCEIFSIAGILNIGFDCVPTIYTPEFQRDQTVIDLINENRKRFPKHRHVGLVWSGNPNNDLNRFRACGLVHYLPLLELDGFVFYSLQKGSPRQDIDKYRAESDGLVDLANALPNMASTATAIEELDLLISTDTSVPHLAGTLGAKSWVILQHPSDWRWTVDKERSPWYPQIRLFRQPRSHDWVSVIEEVKQALLQSTQDHST